MNQRLITFFKFLIVLALNLFIIALILYANSVQNASISTVQTLSKRGSTGEEVKQIQQKLQQLGLYSGSVDGVYGAQTEAAVRSFQQQNGLSADGIAGPVTLKALGISSSSQNNGSVYRRGSRGEMVSKIQRQLSNLGLYSGSIDGIYGSGTESAIRAFQRQKGLSEDGIVGVDTLKALGITDSSSAGGGNGYTQNDYYLLARIISAEARGESYTGQVAVGAVVLNRVEHPSFPDTIAGVIYQPGAFSAINDGQFDQPVADSAYQAAKDALNGWDPSGGAIYYYNPDKTSSEWMLSRPIIKRIGAHLFCT